MLWPISSGLICSAFTSFGNDAKPTLIMASRPSPASRTHGLALANVLICQPAGKRTEKPFTSSVYAGPSSVIEPFAARAGRVAGLGSSATRNERPSMSITVAGRGRVVGLPCASSDADGICATGVAPAGDAAALDDATSFGVATALCGRIFDHTVSATTAAATITQARVIDATLRNRGQIVRIPHVTTASARNASVGYVQTVTRSARASTCTIVATPARRTNDSARPAGPPPDLSARPAHCSPPPRRVTGAGEHLRTRHAAQALKADGSLRHVGRARLTQRREPQSTRRTPRARRKSLNKFPPLSASVCVLRVLCGAILSNFLKPQRTDRRSDRVGAVFQARKLGVIQGDGKGLLGAAAVHDAGDGEADVVDALVATQQRADGKDAVLVVEDRLEDLGRRQPDRVVRRALTLDDLGGGAFHVLEDFDAVADGQLSVAGDGPVLQRDVGDARAAPQRDLAVAVLAGDVGVDVLHRHAAPPRDQEPEPRAVQRRATAEHPLPRQAAELERHVRDHVDGVRHEQEDGVWRDLDELGNELAADVGVRAGQVHPR